MRRSVRTQLVAAGIAVVALAVLGAPGAAAKARHGGGHHGGLSITKSSFGELDDGTKIDRYTLANGKMSVSIITYGGIIQELRAPDRRGRLANITLGYADLHGYTVPRGDDPPTPNPSYFGGIIGRYGNRIGERGVHARRQRVHARRQQRRQPPPRRRPGLRPLPVGGGAVQEAGRGRR